MTKKEQFNTDKEGIKNLVDICHLKGIKHVVISPGSRCAPLTIAFTKHPQIECISIVDERSAAFYALGIAQQVNKPVALVCTSGSAALNYSPAIAEAFYQNIPLMVLTADRPNEWIDQGENQSINQYRIYNNFVKESFQFPVEISTKEDLWYSNRIVSEAVNLCMSLPHGPVHINIPLREPLYQQKQYPKGATPETIDLIEKSNLPGKNELKSFTKEWTRFNKRMIIAGSQDHNNNLQKVLKSISTDPDTIVLYESISNLNISTAISTIDPVVETIESLKDESYEPDLVITMGGGIVSKKLKFFLRKCKNTEHWHIDPSGRHWDTFQHLSKVFAYQPQDLLSSLPVKKGKNGFHQIWKKVHAHTKRAASSFLKKAPFSDLTAFDNVLNDLPSKTNLQLGNSTPVRYANLFHLRTGRSLHVNANRGISGIDGSVSTAAGAAHVNKDLTLCITGDLGFLYDSNALFNQNLSPKLRIIVINNGGGNIFKIIPGPELVDEMEQFIETKHSYSAQHIAKAFKLDYVLVKNRKELVKALNPFLSIKDSDSAAVMEINTDAETSARVIKNYLKSIKESYA